jgi:hypothetical protein
MRTGKYCDGKLGKAPMIFGKSYGGNLENPF